MIRLQRVDRKSFFTGWTPGLFLGVFLYLVCVSLTFAEGRRTKRNLSPCLLFQTTGKPCPLCGGTTASYLLLTGKGKESIQANPLVAASVPLTCLWLLFRLGLGVQVNLALPGRALLITLLFLVLANWCYLISSRKDSTPPLWKQLSGDLTARQETYESPK